MINQRDFCRLHFPAALENTRAGDNRSSALCAEDEKIIPLNYSSRNVNIQSDIFLVGSQSFASARIHVDFSDIFFNLLFDPTGFSCSRFDVDVV